MMYLELTHGRDSKDQIADGQELFDGPVFGPLQYVQGTFGSDIKLSYPEINGEPKWIWYDEDLIRYGGMYYGDWHVIDESLITGEQLARLEQYDYPKTGSEELWAHDRPSRAEIIACVYRLEDSLKDIQRHILINGETSSIDEIEKICDEALNPKTNNPHESH